MVKLDNITMIQNLVKRMKNLKYLTLNKEELPNYSMNFIKWVMLFKIKVSIYDSKKKEVFKKNLKSKDLGLIYIKSIK